MVWKYWTGIRAIVFAAVGLAIVAIQAGGAEPAAAIGRGLWVGGTAFFSEFQGKALKHSGTPRANLAFGSNVFFDPTSMIFDAHHNLWIGFSGVVGNAGAPVLEISAADIAALASGLGVKPAVIIRYASTLKVQAFVVPRSLAFDAAGDLWVSDGDVNGFVEFKPRQIAHSGAPPASIFISAPDFFPGVMRFDGANNLWVAQFELPGTPQQLLRFAPADRAASGPPVPSLTINLPDSLAPQDLAFDSAGNLWVAGSSAHGDALEMFTAADLSGSGETAPTAATTITSSAFGVLSGSGSCLGGIDFDHLGDLWVSVGANNDQCEAAQQVVEFTPGQLGMGGALTPSVVIGQNKRKTNLITPGPVRFGPTL